MKTCLAKLEMAPEDEQKLRRTMEMHNLAWNEVSKVLFETGVVKHTVIHDKTYRKIRRLIPEMPSQVAIKARMDCLSAYKTVKSNKVKLDEPIIRKRLAMRLDTCLFSLAKDEQGNPMARFTVAGSRRCRVQGKIVVYSRLLEMMRHEMADPLVFERDDQMWLAMSFRTPEATHIPDKCIGVDLGERRFAVTSEGLMIKLPELAAARRKLKRIKRRERNQSRQMCHLAANQILKTQASTIVLEDLSRIKEDTKFHKGTKVLRTKHNNRLSQAPFYNFKTILTYKAQALGKRVETVDPAYTSQDDSRGLARGTRQGCRYYASDGVILDADHNAAINIAQRWASWNKLPVSFAEPLRARQTLWAGCSQSAECGVPLVPQAHDFSRG